MNSYGTLSEKCNIFMYHDSTKLITIPQLIPHSGLFLVNEMQTPFKIGQIGIKDAQCSETCEKYYF